MSAVLLTRLKIADLAAWTALEAGRRLLPPGDALTRLAREELYLFQPAEGFAAEAFEGPLLHAIETSNFFVNPNKEVYRFLATSARGAAFEPPALAQGILARARDDTRDGELWTRLKREHPLEGLGAIRRARLWWIWSRGPDGGPAFEACYGALGRVTGTARGLLVNPHAEADLAIVDSVPWRRVEEFLTHAAPELEQAA